MAGFETYRVQQLRQPCAGPMDKTFAAVLGAMQDRELALLRVAALARIPRYCPDDATDLLLGWFGLDRYPGDTPDTIRARCAAAFPLYELGGSPQSMIDALTLFLGAGADVRVLTESYDGPIYEGSHYSRGRVVLGPSFGTSGIGPGNLGAVTLGAWVLGSSMTVAQRSTLKRLAWTWKDSYGIVVDVLLNYADGSLGFDTVLGSFVLGGPDTSSTLTVLPQFGSQTWLGTWVLGLPDLT